MRTSSVLLALLVLVWLGHVEAAEAAPSDDAVPTAQWTPRYVPPKPLLAVMNEGAIREAIVLKFVQPSQVRLRDGELKSLDGRHDLLPLNEFLARYPDLKITRLFTRPEEALDAERIAGEARTKQELGDLNLYYLIDLREVEGVDPVGFVNELNGFDLVEIAYPMERPEPASIFTEQGGIQAVTLHPEVIGNYEAEQGYLDPAPAGIDAEWAWGLTGGRGSNVRFIDIEWDWNLDHVDLGTEFVRIPGTYTVPGPGCDTTLPPPVNVCTFPTNHGTAVLGEVVSLDNGWGTTGIASNAQWGVSNANNGTAWPNVANAINLAAASLSAGDILLYEMHALGPDSGLVCPCNCDQFEYIAMEYWQANFDATAAAVALGIHVVEAAGNGSMDLDSAIYGGRFNRAVRDSGAILVGGGSSATHSPMCWTNFGSRVDMQGWGENVVTLGYGSRYSDFVLTCPPNTNCTGSHNNLYANGFNGTSSASPIIVGAAAIVEGVSETKYGIVLSPARMRQILPINGTPQGTPPNGNIGPLPNLRQVIRADLVRFHPGGWTDSLVARDTTGCTGGSCNVTATLPGNSASTYVSYSGRNDGIYETTGIEARVFVDDGWAWWNSWGPLWPGAWPGSLDAGPITVRGGRHTLRVDWDYWNDTPEWSETNNTDTAQYVWSPYILSANTPVVRAAPPDKDTTGFSWYNCDGFQATGLGGSYSWWVGTAVLPVNSGDDYDVRLHDETPTSTTGFGSGVAYSGWGYGASDFVLANGNAIGSMSTRWTGVLQGNPTPGTGDAVVEFSVGSSWGTARGVHGPYSLGSGRILHVHEIYFGPSDVGVHFDFKLDNLGAADLGFSFYEAGGSYFAKSNFMTGGYADSGAAGLDETFSVEIPASGWYGLVVWKVGSADRLLSSDYTIAISETLPDLEPYKQPDWTSPLVLRDAAGCTAGACVDTATLFGNSTLTYFNSTVTNTGPNPSTGTHRVQYYLDDVPWGWMEDPNPLPPGGLSWHINFQSLGIIPGGRHTARMDADVYNGVPESDETDNTYTKQYVWSPYLLSSGTPVTRSAPPDRDSLGYFWFNCDGFSFETSWWGAVGALSASASDNYDVRLHNDYAGSASGFGSNLAWSDQGPGLSDFVMVNGNRVGVNTTWYTGVIQGASAPGSGNVAVQHVDQAASVSPPGTWSYGIPSGGVMFLLEFNFLTSAGKTYGFRLWNDSGGADLGFGLYSETGSYFRKTDALVQANAAGHGGNEQFLVTIPTNGWYGLAVWKNDSTDLGLASNFRIQVAEVLPTEVPDGTGAPGIRVSRPGVSEIAITWSADCNQNPSTNYSLYTGDLNDLRASGTWDYTAAPVVCDAGQDLTETVGMPAGNVFFLVVPHDGVVEGSYGSSSSGLERPSAGPVACHPQNLTGMCF